ncbi:DUF6185 family protein [Streptomyces rhizosphaericus]|uniref:Uncharacterized protein n=1 Tax=Streptomyces rhizosphaericus TaxID=114699 RepID=A0A6G4AS76_9ACTN|nr:DUF6185 family protein [Streptomyces rhizosphaericus]NEW75317.1 hypothetical protein [Streptomyces rhizosphaericus]
MAANRWWRWQALLIVMVAWWGLWPTEVRAAAPDSCKVGEAGTPEVEAAIRFFHHGQTFVQAQATTTITVQNSWSPTEKLTLGGKSKGYRNAMRCLLRGKKSAEPTPYWKDEWRLHGPEVTEKDDRTTVQYKAFALIEHSGDIAFGPWIINVPKKNASWNVSLHPENLGPAVKNAQWKRVEIRLGGLDARRASPGASRADEDTRVWSTEQPPNVSIDVLPPWHAFFALSSARQPTWSRLCIALWWVCGSVVFALAVFRARLDPAAAPGPKAQGIKWRVLAISKDPQARPAKAALRWAGLSAGLGVALALIRQPETFSLWHTLAGAAAAVVLISVARPWLPHTSSDGPNTEAEKVHLQRGRALARTVILTALLLVALGLLALLDPELVYMPKELAPPNTRVTWQVLSQLAMLWLWLAAMAAWAWRFAREGELVPWSRTWDQARARCIGAVGAALAVVALVMLISYRWSVDLNWQRATWLGDDEPGYHSTHDESLGLYLVKFGPVGLSWAYAYTWVLTIIALVALLNIRAKSAQEQVYRNPDKAFMEPRRNDMRLTAVVFAIAAATRVSLVAGSSVLLFVWLLLNIASLYAVVAVGRRWSVLHQTSGAIEGLSTKQGREPLLEKAHRYRTLHQKLRLVDQGHEEKTTRDEVEDELRKLRHWRPAGCDHDCLPDQVSVVDVALTWGPEDTWWKNARHAARLAFFFGIPASIVIVWANNLKDSKQLMLTSGRPTALAEIVATFLTWQITWAGAGLALGALWRVLPGRRGPMRAVCMTGAYVIPIAVGALINRITDSELGTAVLSSSLMLIVLTLTSIGMDMATFSGEKQLWPTRLSLLLSIYQMRTLSVQGAFLIGQLALAAEIWNNLAGPPLKP